MSDKNLIHVDDICNTFMWDSGDPVEWGEAIIASVKNPKEITLFFPDVRNMSYAKMLAAKFSTRVKSVQLGRIGNMHMGKKCVQLVKIGNKHSGK